MRFAIVSLGVLLVMGCVQTPPAQAESLVKADPKTLVLQPGDYPPAWAPDAASSGPADDYFTGGGPKPMDSYAAVIDAAGSILTSTVVLYGATSDARAAFGTRYPDGATTLSFGRPFTVGDQQRVYGITVGQAHVVRMVWQSGNVVAGLDLLHRPTTYYPTASSLAALMDGPSLLEFEQLAPRVETHIRLARNSK